MNEELCTKCLTRMLTDAMKKDKAKEQFYFECAVKHGEPPVNCPYILEHILTRKQKSWVKKLTNWVMEIKSKV